MEYNTTTVQTEAGDYRISEHYDSDGGIGNPLTEYDHEGMAFAIYQERKYETVNTLGGLAGSAVQSWIDAGYDDDQIERRFGLWQRITGDQTVLVTREVSADRSTWYRCIVLVDKDERYPNWDRKGVALATLREFESWSRGEVYGYVVDGPDGSHVDSCWGFIGDESRRYMLDQARDSVAYDAQQRLDKANLAGAGFVGIV